jgi:Glycosyl hydrolase family 1
MFDKYTGNAVEINVGYEATPIGENPMEDVLSVTHHYDQFETDFDLQAELGIQGNRYSINWSKVWRGNGRYDLSFYDPIFEAMLARGFDVTVDPIHHRAAMQIPGGFANPDFPQYAVEYALAIKEHFPGIKRWVPMNEPALTAFMHSHQDRTWATPPWSNTYLPWKDGYLNMMKGIVMIMRALKEKDPWMEFFLPEPLSHHSAADPNNTEVNRKVDFLNNIARFAMDELLNGKVDEKHEWRTHLLSEGATHAEVDWFLENPAEPYCRDFDVYIQQNHCWCTMDKFVIDPNPKSVAGLIGLHRQRMPYLKYNIAETNIRGSIVDRIIWFKHVYLQSRLAKIERLTWWGLIDSDTWGNNNFTNRFSPWKSYNDPVGIYALKDDDKNRRRLWHRVNTEFAEIVAAVVKGELAVEDIPDLKPTGEFKNQLPAFIKFNKEALEQSNALFLSIFFISDRSVFLKMRLWKATTPV